MLISQLRCVPVCFIVAFPCAAVNILLFLSAFDGKWCSAYTGVRYSGGTAGTANSWRSGTRIMGWVRASAQASISSSTKVASCPIRPTFQ